jgi:hypothetical protein
VDRDIVAPSAFLDLDMGYDPKQAISRYSSPRQSASQLSIHQAMGGSISDVCLHSDDASWEFGPTQRND